MSSAYERTDIISFLRSKYIIRRKPYIILRQQYIMKSEVGGKASETPPVADEVRMAWRSGQFFVSVVLPLMSFGFSQVKSLLPRKSV